MCPSLLGDAKLYALLLAYDGDLASDARAAGCACGGALHSARFPRKPRGPAGVVLPEGYDRRDSFCCANDGCRRRTTPPSVRFLGRKVYLGAVVTLVTAMKHGVTARRAAELRRAIGVNRRALARWRTWWCEAFVMTAFWQTARAMLSPPVVTNELPASLVERFEVAGASPLAGLVKMLAFIKPVTTTSGRERNSMAR